MRIAIQTLGTRGDVQPYVALALGLMRRGHDVQIGAPIQFADMVSRRGVGVAPLPGEFLALLDSPEGKAAVAGGQGFSAGLKLLKHVRPLMRRLFDEEWAAVRAFQPDLVLHHPKSVASPHLAEAVGCARMLATPVPGFTPTAAFPSPMLPFASLGPLNRVSHSLVIKGADLLFARTIGEWRTTSLGLARGAATSRDAGTLYAYSRHMLPAPHDWDARRVLVSGYWFLDSADWEPAADLAAFLAAGEPPVYIGFGSMPGLDPQNVTRILIEALARTRKRGLLATGGGALDAADGPSHVKVITDAPHDRLLPQVAAAIHHGGAGTTGAVLRAGIPMTICPFLGDQPFWGRRVATLGVGPQPLDRKTLSVESVSAAITAMDDPAMRSRAAMLGAQVRQEDGVAAAVTFIEDRAGGIRG